MMAARGDHLETMRALVAGGADPLIRAQDGTNLLMAAASGGKLATVKYAYELDPNVDVVTTGSGNTIMHVAVGLAGRTQPEVVEVMQFLADHGAKLDEMNAANRTPISLADGLPVDLAVDLLTKLISRERQQAEDSFQAIAGETRGMKPGALALNVMMVTLLAVPAVAQQAASKDFRVLEAVKRRDQRALALLIRAKADVNAAQPDGATALAWAVHLGERSMVETLLGAGAKVNVVDEYGETPLTLAAANGDEAIVQRLLKAGANARAARWNGETALMIAAECREPRDRASTGSPWRRRQRRGAPSRPDRPYVGGRRRARRCRHCAPRDWRRPESGFQERLQRARICGSRK